MNMPEWLYQLPFACMVTDKVIRKAMATRIVEGAIIAGLGGPVAATSSCR